MQNINVLAICFLLLWFHASAYRHGHCRDAGYERDSHSIEDDLQVEASMTKKAPLVQKNKESEEEEEEEVDDLESHEGWQGGKIYEGSWWDGWAKGWHASVKKQISKDSKYTGPKGQHDKMKAESQTRTKVHNSQEKHPRKVAPFFYKGYGTFAHYGGYRYPNPYFYGRYGYKPIPYGGYRPGLPLYGGYGLRSPFHAPYPRPVVGHHHIYGQRYGSYGAMYRSPYLYRG